MTPIGRFVRAWLCAHPKTTTGIVCFLLGFVLGYIAHRTPAAPEVHAKQEEHKDVSAAEQMTQKTETGPKKIITLNFDPSPARPPPAAGVVNFPEKTGSPPDLCRPVVVPGLGTVTAPPGERLESVTIEDDAPSTTETRAQAEQHEQLDRKLDLAVRPVALPQWQAQVGIEDALHARTVRVAVRRRIFGPVWAELSAVPLQRSIGVAGGIEW